MRPHSIAYHVGDCTCQGTLKITKNLSDGSFFIMCDDCMSVWRDPKKWYLMTAYNVYNINTRNTTLEEIKDLGWEKYITGNYIDYDCV